MIKKIFAVMLCFIFILGVSTMAFAKKAKTKETVTKAEAPEEAPPVVKHKAEPLDPMKDKISIALDAFNQSASMRFWATNHLGIDVSAGFSYLGGDASTYGFKLGGGLVFPMLETENFNVYMTPGLSIGFGKTTITAGGTSFGESNFQFLAGAGLEFEAFLVKNVFSIGSSVKVMLGVNSTTPDNGSATTGFVFSAADSIAITPLILRFYM